MHALVFAGSPSKINIVLSTTDSKYAFINGAIENHVTIQKLTKVKLNKIY